MALNDPVAVRLQTLRGVGPMVATALVAAVGNGQQFANGRQMAASLGLTPRQYSSGNKQRLLGISKRGDSYLRSLLVHGARSAIYAARNKEDRLSQWVTGLAARRHANVAAVALANKTVRMAWAMLRNEAEYDPDWAITWSLNNHYFFNKPGEPSHTIVKQTERWRTGRTGAGRTREWLCA